MSGLWEKYQDDEPMALVRERPVRLDYEAAARVLQEEHKRYREGWSPLPFTELAKAVVDAAIGDRSVYPKEAENE